MEQLDPRVDAYIEKSAAFAKPVLKHIRQLVHQTSPLITETIKWGFPFFDYKGPLCNMAAFKQHCSMGFWKAALLNDPNGIINKGDEPSAGSFGRLTSIADLPPDEVIADFIKQAIILNETGAKGVMKPAAPKTEIYVPNYFTAALAEHPKAKAAFEAFSPSHRKEYLEWIIEAKTDATRQKRMETAIEWMEEGKSRHWKYK